MTLIFSEATATFEKLQLGCNMSLVGSEGILGWCWSGCRLAVGMFRVIGCVCFWVKHMLCYSYSDSVTLYFAQCTLNEQRGERVASGGWRMAGSGWRVTVTTEMRLVVAWLGFGLAWRWLRATSCSIGSANCTRHLDGCSNSNAGAGVASVTISTISGSLLLFALDTNV